MRKGLYSIGILVLIALLAVGVVAAQDGNASGDEGYPVNTISVTGTGTAIGVPDIANVEIGVQVVNPSISVAFSQANTALEGVIAAIMNTGVVREDIRTTGLDVYAQESFGGPMPMTESGMAQDGPQLQYNVSNRVRVIVRDVANVENVLTAAVDSGANQIFGLSFGIEDQDALLQEARLNAVENARDNAEQLAAAVGAELGEVIIISETQNASGPFNARNLGFAADEGGFGGGGATIEPGQLNVNVSVNVTYRLAR